MNPGILVMFLFGGIAITLEILHILTMRIPSERLTPESKLTSVVFKERYASGRSKENVLTSLLWAHYHLKVYVTPEILRILPHQLYRSQNSFTFLDLEISLNKIFDVKVARGRWGRKLVVVKYLDSKMRMQEIELVLKRRKEFIRSVRGW